MTILAIETATAVCGAAVVNDGNVCAERFVEAQQVHSQKIIGLIDDVLRSVRMKAEDAQGIAISIGPGSFTGLRVGLSTAKGLTYALEKPLAAVPTLEGIALNVVLHVQVQDGSLILSMIDARRNEVYAAAYISNGDELKEVISPRAAALEDLYDLLDEERRILLAGDGADKFYRFVETKYPDRTKRFHLLQREQRLCSAASVGILGERRLVRGARADVASLEPYYMKEFYTTIKPQPLVQR